MTSIETDWTEWEPPPPHLPALDPDTLAAVRELQGGEVERSTGHLFEIFEPQLCAYFRRHDCQKVEAEELAQTVLIRMLEQIDTLKDPARLHFWLFKIAGNTLRNFVRDRARDRERHEDFADQARKDSEPVAFWVRGSFEPNPEAKLMMSETVDRRRLLLDKLLQATRLAPASRRSLLLRLRGDSQQEIARALGIPTGTVKSHLSRASSALIRNLEKIDLSALSAGDAVDAAVAELSSELLTFKREALEADPAYFRAGTLESGGGDAEAAEEKDELPPILFAKKDSKKKNRKAARTADSPAAIAAVARQDQRRGRPRRRLRMTILPVAERGLEPDLGRLERDGLGYSLILLEEAAAGIGEHGGNGDGRIALKARLACVEALLARGRRFAVARQVEDLVRLAIVLIDNAKPGETGRDASRRDRQIHHKVLAGRSLLGSYLGHRPKEVELAA